MNKITVLNWKIEIMICFGPYGPNYAEDFVSVPGASMIWTLFDNAIFNYTYFKNKESTSG